MISLLCIIVSKNYYDVFSEFLFFIPAVQGVSAWRALIVCTHLVFLYFFSLQHSQAQQMVLSMTLREQKKSKTTYCQEPKNKTVFRLTVRRDLLNWAVSKKLHACRSTAKGIILRGNKVVSNRTSSVNHLLKWLTKHRQLLKGSKNHV